MRGGPISPKNSVSSPIKIKAHVLRRYCRALIRQTLAQCDGDTPLTTPSLWSQDDKSQQETAQPAPCRGGSTCRTAVAFRARSRSCGKCRICQRHAAGPAGHQRRAEDRREQVELRESTLYGWCALERVTKCLWRRCAGLLCYSACPRRHAWPETAKRILLGAFSNDADSLSFLFTKAVQKKLILA
jgi:hypothetical protein